MNPRSLVVLVGLSCAISAGAQVLWREPPTVTRPPARVNAAMADAPADSTVLFGGSNRLLVAFDDTWVWDRGTGNWVAVSVTTRPPAREQHAMAFLQSRQDVVMFGGLRSSGPGQPPTVYGDTWVWDGSAWHQLSSTVAPTARYDHAMAYDASRGVVVLFGGLDANGARLGDTWEFSGAQWRQMTQPAPPLAPSPRSGHAMAFVGPLPPRVVLFGGTDGTADLGDTWEWDGVDWVLRTTTTSPSARWSHTMVHDATQRRALLFGGAESVPPLGVRPLGDTWAWNGAAWEVSSFSTAPAVRFGHAMTYDGYRLTGNLEPEVVLFGGKSGATLDPRDDTWLGEVWRTASFTPFGTGCAGSSTPLVLTNINDSRPWIGEMLAMRVSPLPSSGYPLGFGVLGASNTSWGGNPLPISLGGPPFFLHPSCSLYVSVDVTSYIPSIPLPFVSWLLPIPDDPNLVGISLYLQAFGIDPGAVGGLVTSNAAKLEIGMRQ